MEKIAVVGGSKKFREFLTLTGAPVVWVESISQVLRDESFTALLMIPDYDNGQETIAQLPLEDVEILAARKLSGFRVYAENYYAYNFYHASVFGVEVTGKVCHVINESFCAQNGLQFELENGRMLQSIGAAYLPGRTVFWDCYTKINTLLLTLGRYVATSQIQRKVVNPLPMLTRSGSVYTALFSMSNFDPINMKPNCRWKKLYASVFSYVLNVSREAVEAAFAKVFPPIQTRMNINDRISAENWKDRSEQALYDAVKWHFDSGIIMNKDGSDGALEMVMSGNGQDLYRNRRVDAGLYTGWITYAAGKYFDKEEWKTAGKNVFDYFLKHGQLEGGTQDGLFTWCYNENAGPHVLYSIDCGRDGIALCNMYQLTGDESYLPRIRRLADAFVNWMNGELIYSNCIWYDWPLSNKPYSAYTNMVTARTPAVYGEMSSFMTMASRILGDRKYLDVMLRIADRLVKDYPNYDFYGHTTSSCNARMLMVLTCVHLTGERDYTELINEMIDYLATLQQPCGGTYSEDNMTFERYSMDVNELGENGITTPWDNDKISDQLYCVNNALAALSALKAVPDGSGIHKQKGLDMLHKLLEYVMKIQIVSDDPRFNGGWMRAYSITHEEYYGLDMDLWWGPYCVMAGWIMGIIPMAVLNDLTDECAYTLSLPE